MEPSSWYYDSVAYAYENGLFSGTGIHSFSPGQPTVPDNYDGVSFSDVPSGQYYTQGVKWAGSRGIVRGTGASTFSPNANITREQFAIMLYRYAVSYSGIAPVSASLDNFFDGGAVSNYARTAMGWCTATGTITGKDNGRLDPSGQATRAEVAAMLLRLSHLPQGNEGYRTALTALTDTDVFFYDLDGDGTEEAFVTYRQGQSRVGSVFTRRDGAVLPLLKDEETYKFVSSFDGGLGVIERDGQLFACIRQSHVGTSHPSYRYQGFYRLYRVEGDSLTLADEMVYDLRVMADTVISYQADIT